MKSRFAILFAFDGTDYCGWQTQKGIGRHSNPKLSIEETLATAIYEVCAETVTVVASGRTDAGVHASGQVAHFELTSGRFSEKSLILGINQELPDTIQILALEQVPREFHAKEAIRKQYSYYFQQGPAQLPHLRTTALWDHYPLDGDLMQKSLSCLQGEHDFAGFSAAGAKVNSTVRSLHEVEITHHPISLPGEYDTSTHFLWRLRLVGSGFLKQMVRTIAGTVKQIGEGQRPAEDMAMILESRDRTLAGPTAPACGLWLERVWYPKQEGLDFLHQTE